MKKDYILISLITAFATVGIVLLINNFSLTTNSVASLSSDDGNSISYHSDVCIQTRSAGETEWHLVQCKHNLFTEAGKNITRDLLAGQTATNNISYIALGNGSGAINMTGAGGVITLNFQNGTFGAPVGANETIHDCGLAPQSGTVTYQQNNANCAGGGFGGCSGNWSITKTFTNSCGANSLNQTALLNLTTGFVGTSIAANSSYFAVNNFTMATLQTNDQINVTWFIWVS